MQSDGGDIILPLRAAGYLNRSSSVTSDWTIPEYRFGVIGASIAPNLVLGIVVTPMVGALVTTPQLRIPQPHSSFRGIFCSHRDTETQRFFLCYKMTAVSSYCVSK